MKKQQGFVALETILILIVIAIVAFTGWYVWHSTNNADTIYNSSINSKKSTSAEKTKYFSGSDAYVGFYYPSAWGTVNVTSQAGTTGTETSFSFSYDGGKSVMEALSTDWTPGPNSVFTKKQANLCKVATNYVVYQDDTTCVVMVGSAPSSETGSTPTATFWIQKHISPGPTAEIWFSGAPLAVKDLSQTSLKHAYESGWGSQYDMVAFAKSMTGVQ